MLPEEESPEPSLVLGTPGPADSRDGVTLHPGLGRGEGFEWSQPVS